MQNRGGDSPRLSPSEPALRIIMRRLREIMAEPAAASPGSTDRAPDRRPDGRRGVLDLPEAPDGSLELFATEGLKPDAVHGTFCKRAKVWSGAAPNWPCRSTSLTRIHPGLLLSAETGEEIYHSFLAVPLLRGGDVLGVLTVQNKPHGEYSDEDVEVLQTTAMVLAEHLVSGAVAGVKGSRSKRERAT